MGKSHRGKGIIRLPHRGRGTCPNCQRTGVKLLYDRTAKDGTKVKVCKQCRNKAL